MTAQRPGGGRKQRRLSHGGDQSPAETRQEHAAAPGPRSHADRQETAESALSSSPPQRRPAIKREQLNADALYGDRDNIGNAKNSTIKGGRPVSAIRADVRTFDKNDRSIWRRQGAAKTILGRKRKRTESEAKWGGVVNFDSGFNRGVTA